MLSQTMLSMGPCAENDCLYKLSVQGLLTESQRLPSKHWVSGEETAVSAGLK